MHKISNILLTGSGGVLATALLDELCTSNEFSVWAVSSQPEKIRQRFPHYRHLNLIAKDALSRSYTFPEHIDLVIHAAFSRSDSAWHMAESLNYTAEIFNQARQSGTRAVINISSRSVYGQGNIPPWHENTQPAPSGIYGLAKYAGELLADQLQKATSDSFRICSIRLAGLTSPELSQRSTSRLVSRIKQGKPMIIKGGQQQFAYLDVRDAASGILALVKTPAEKWKNLYNLGHPTTHTLIEIAREANRLAPEFQLSPVEVLVEDTMVTLYDGMDCSRFFTDTGWRPKYKLEDILREAYKVV